uniref:Tf2-1-like SH3-like domain-containing protein n=1 Tax=Nelumbo nucifera TaxID=4432 RepID=A0A822ZTP7_NELNU|nr:TPA_asm: hypothetical protein HUJ06_003477 [Nelumbo nucifera]
MKITHDCEWRHVEFQVDDWVYIRLQPYRQSSLAACPYHKLSPRYYEPFLILAWIGPITHKLELLANSKVHSIFHVAILKKCVQGTKVAGTSLSDTNVEGKLIVEPKHIMDFHWDHQEWKVIIEALVE